MKRKIFLPALIFVFAMVFQVEIKHGQSSGFNDSFDDNAPDTTRWAIGALHDIRFNALIQVAEQSQQLHIITPANAIGYGGYVTASTWNFTNASASVEVVQAASEGNDTVFALGINSDNRYRFVVEEGFLYFQYKVNGSPVDSLRVPYNATQHRFWRFNHNQAADQIVFETSSNGADWTAQRSVARQFANTAVKIEIDSGSFHTGSGLTTAIFDNFKLEANVAPPPPSSDDPMLPLQTVDTTYPANTGATYTVSNSAELQSRLNTCNPGDTIMVNPGIYNAPSGGFKLRNKNTSSTQWIIIRSSNNTFDSTGSIRPGTRVNGADPLHTSRMPKIISNEANVPAIATEAGAHHYRLVGLEFGISSNLSSTDNTVSLGTGGETSIASLPSFIIIDRCYAHGNDADASPYHNYHHGIALHGIHLAVIDSHISNYHGKGADAQAIWGSNGQGPFKIENNFIEAAGENIMFGGQDPSIDQLVPTDIEIKRNHFTKRISWRAIAGLTVKNLFELKNARRVLVDGNLFEQTWDGGQDTAILIKSTNQEVRCDWCVSEHVTFSNNVVRHAPNALRILAKDRGATTIAEPLPANHIKIYNNLFYDISQTWGSGSGRIFQIENGVSHVQIIHNTAEGSCKSLGAYDPSDVNPNLIFRDNIIERGSYGIHASSEGVLTLTNNFGPLTSTSYRKNLLVNTSDEPGNCDPTQSGSDTSIVSRYPTPCMTPNTACASAETFIASSWNNVGFVDRAKGNYRLASTSPFKGRASDGKDLGCNMDALSVPNPIDDQRTFVHQQYQDFLNREPDGPGWDFWTDNINLCNDPSRRPSGQTVEQCIDLQRVTTSAAFFLSPEFQYTGGYVYRFYKGGLGRQPLFSEFTTDAQIISQGILVNGQLHGPTIEQNKSTYANQFVQKPEFLQIYGGLNNQQYVDLLFAKTHITPSDSERQALVTGLNNGTETRAKVLHKVVDGTFVISEGNQQFTTSYGKAFYDRVFNEAFVTMEYFGYLRRDPDAPGFDHWLSKLDFFGGDYIKAEMVRAFIISPEYRSRFGKDESGSLSSTSALMDVAAGSVENIIWTNCVGVSVSANSLSNTASGWNTSGAVSTQVITARDGYAEFTTSENSTYRMFGLSNGSSDHNYTDIDFAIYPAADGNLYVYEAGSNRGWFGPYYPGDRLRVSVEDGMVKYRRNGSLLYTSSVTPTYPLLVDTAFYTYGATITNAVIAGRLDHGAAAGVVPFYSGFESAQRQPDWNNSADYITNVGGYCCGLTYTESSPRQELAYFGTTSLMYSGYDNSASGPSYSYNKVFDVSISVTANTELSYWIYPQGVSGNNSAYVSVDLFCTDGSSLRDSGAIDQWGVRLHPAFQGAGGRLSLNQWNLVRSKIGAWLAGKTIYRIYVAYDQPQNVGAYRGYIDDISIIDGNQ